jgi:PST family polysaccharide transporter
MTSAVAELELPRPPADAPAPSRSRADSLAASVVVLLLMTVAQRAIGFGRGVMFCRWLEPEQLGQWDVAFGFLNLAAPLAVLGLPGAFGRYVEYFRYRGQFHSFLRRTCVVSALCGVTAVTVVITHRDGFSRFVFGTTVDGPLMMWIGLSLAAVIAHNFLVSLFIAVRRYRVVTVLQFVQSLGFAAIGLSLLALWPRATTSVVIAFALATLASLACASIWLRALVADEPGDHTESDHGTFWAKLIPFAAWMWVTNLLVNSSELVDRYMIIHHGGFSADDALKQVGYYHSSRLVPLMLVGVASLIGSMITPHLSHDWERGHREAVVRRLNMTLKLLFAGLTAASVVALVLAPWMFHFAFKQKFGDGLAVLPWTLTYCVWFGTMAVAQNYLWCVERPGLSSMALLVGLLCNVGVNLLLLPRFGLEGAVWATTVANFVTLTLTLALSRWQGMRIDLGTCVLAVMPLSLACGPWTAALALAAVLMTIASTNWLLVRDEKRELWLLANEFAHRVSSLWQRLVGRAAEPS